MILGFILSLFTLLPFGQDALALDVRYSSDTCKELRQTNGHQSDGDNPDITTCYNAFYLDASDATRELAPDINNISQHIVKIGTLENLSTILKNQFLNNITAKYSQTLILAKGMGLKDEKLKNSIETKTNACSQDSEKLKNHLQGIHKNFKSPSKAEMKKHRDAFIKKMYSAFVEKYRLQNLLKTMEKKAPENSEQIKNIKADIAKLHQHYPLLNHIRENGVGSDKYAKMLTQRMMLKLRAPRGIDAITHSYQTHPKINEYLGLKDENTIQTEYKKLKPPHHRKNPYFYSFLHTNIHNGKYKDAFFEKEILRGIEDSAKNSLDSIEKICKADACEMFSYAPYEVGDIISGVQDDYTRTQITQAACQCKIGHRKETISTGVHLGIVAGTIGLAVGCVAFPPLCIGAVTLGLAGTGAGIKDYMTVSENNKKMIEEARVISSRSEFTKNYVMTLTDLNESNEEMAMSNLFLPLEFVGGAGDLIATVKHAPKVLTVFSKGTTSPKTNLKPLKTPEKKQDLEISITKPVYPEAAKLFDTLKDRKTLLDQFNFFDPTTDAQRLAWINKAKKADADLFVDIENGAMKRLNDLGDKDAVTAITNLQKKLVFERMEKLLAKYPNLKIDSYSDFKSSRFAFTGDIPPGFKNELNELFLEVNDDLNNIVLNLMKKGELKIPGHEIPKNWFAAGIGNNADQAGLAARESRCGSSTVRCFSEMKDFKDIHTKLYGALVKNNEYRRNITKKLKSFKTNPPLLGQTKDGRTIPSLELIEVVRKNLDKSPEDLRALIANNFKGVNLNDNTINVLKEYTHTLKKFEPGIWSETRKVASLDEASHGGFSADFTGMGSYNLQQVAADLADNQHSLDNAVSSLRTGEDSVTQMFNGRKKMFMEFSEQIYKDHNIPIEKVCSGDDCVIYPKKNLGISPKAQEELELAMLAKINASNAPSGFRLSFIPPGVQKQARSELATQGELIEKQIRKKAFGTGAKTIEVSKGSKVTIGIKMPKTLHKGKVKIYIASQENLSEAEKLIIKKAVLESITEVNSALNQTAKEAGSNLNSKYKLSDIIIQ